MRKGASLTVAPTVEKALQSYEIVGLHAASMDPLAAAPAWFVYANTQANLVAGLQRRVLAEIPAPSVNIEALRYAVRELGKCLPRSLAPLSREDFLNCYSGRKRERYARAFEALPPGDVPSRFFKLSAFVKAELMPADKLIDGKAPRIIQFRDLRGGVALGLYTKALEPFLYDIHGRAGGALPPGRAIGKGLNLEQRAELIASKVRAFGRCVAFSLDCTAFDMHVIVEILRAEHQVYKNAFAPQYRSALMKALDYQLLNRGRSMDGSVRYVNPGGRSSGDFNTALGNCLIILILLIMSFRRCKIRWMTACDGDDTVLFVSVVGDDAEKAIALVRRVFADHGQVLRIEQRVVLDDDSLELLEWCQTRIVRLHDRLVMIPAPEKVVYRSLISTRFAGMSSRQVAEHVGAIGVAYGLMYRGVPVYQSYAGMLMRWAGAEFDRDYFQHFTDADGLWHQVRGLLRHYKQSTLTRAEPVEVGDEARASFERAWGIRVHTQLELEAEFAEREAPDWSKIESLQLEPFRALAGDFLYR